MKRMSSVIWKGTGKNGSGKVSTQSHVLDNAHYAWNTRFEDIKGTNPEELLAAAHAMCFTMKLSFLLSNAGYEPEIIETSVEVTLGKDSISQSHIEVKGEVPGITTKEFQEHAENARENCLVSKALNVDITLVAELKAKTMA